jgi:hypothetical protein
MKDRADPRGDGVHDVGGHLPALSSTHRPDANRGKRREINPAVLA